MGCALMFTMPFMIGGLMVVFLALRKGDSGQEFWIQLAVGSLFAIVGGGITFGAWYGVRALAKKAQLRKMYADEPWKWREDWARGVAEDRLHKAGVFFWIFALSWTAISSPVAFLIPGELAKGNKMILIALLFPLVGLILLASALYMSVRKAKYGQSVFHLDTVPFSPGRSVGGSVRVRLSDMPAEGFAMKLSSVHRVVTGSGKNSSTRETVLWQEEKMIPAGAAAPNPDGVLLPVNFALPRDAHPTDESFSSNSYHWRLHISADVPGIDYTAEFELPVFGVAPRDAWDTGGEPVFGSEPERRDTRLWTPGPDSGITITRSAGGTEVFEIRRVKKSFASLLFPLIWFGGMGAMFWFFDPPGVVTTFLGIIGLIIAIALLDARFGWSRIEASSAGVTVNGGILVYKWTRQIAADEIRDIRSAIGASTNDKGGSVQYGVYIDRKHGGRVVAATWLPVKRDAEMLAARLISVVKG